jgi:hypothetical protein
VIASKMSSQQVQTNNNNSDDGGDGGDNGYVFQDRLTDIIGSNGQRMTRAEALGLNHVENDEGVHTEITQVAQATEAVETVETVEAVITNITG